MTSRLVTKMPRLAERLYKASSSARYDASLAACEMALATTGVIHPAVTYALRCIRDGVLLNNEESAELRNLTEELDRRYLELQVKAEREEATEAEYLQLFSKARAVAALSLASTARSKEAASEAIYEAAAAMGDRDSELFALVDTLLS